MEEIEDLRETNSPEAHVWDDNEQIPHDNYLPHLEREVKNFQELLEEKTTKLEIQNDISMKLQQENEMKNTELLNAKQMITESSDKLQKSEYLNKVHLDESKWFAIERNVS